MDFIVPNLWVAKELEWNKNNSSNRLDALEKLEEDRLKDAVGIYAKNDVKSFGMIQRWEENTSERGI